MVCQNRGIDGFWGPSWVLITMAPRASVGHGVRILPCGEILNVYLQKKKKEKKKKGTSVYCTVRAPSVGRHNSTRVDDGRELKSSRDKKCKARNKRDGKYIYDHRLVDRSFYQVCSSSIVWSTFLQVPGMYVAVAQYVVRFCKYRLCSSSIVWGVRG